MWLISDAAAESASEPPSSNQSSWLSRTKRLTDSIATAASKLKQQAATFIQELDVEVIEDDDDESKGSPSPPQAELDLSQLLRPSDDFYLCPVYHVYQRSVQSLPRAQREQHALLPSALMLTVCHRRLLMITDGYVLCLRLSVSLQDDCQPLSEDLMMQNEQLFPSSCQEQIAVDARCGMCHLLWKRSLSQLQKMTLRTTKSSADGGANARKLLVLHWSSDDEGAELTATLFLTDGLERTIDALRSRWQAFKLRTTHAQKAQVAATNDEELP